MFGEENSDFVDWGLNIFLEMSEEFFIILEWFSTGGGDQGSGIQEYWFNQWVLGDFLSHELVNFDVEVSSDL